MTTTPKPFVFVLMPFDSDFKDVYELGIKAACLEAGAYCERVDEQIFQESILERIYNQIAKADIIVAELTGKNPNVYYETGYAHGIGKTTILLVKDAVEIPFDMKHYPHIVYGNSIASMKSQLASRIKWHIDNPKTVTVEPEVDLTVYVNGRDISTDINVQVKAFGDAVAFLTSTGKQEPTILTGQLTVAVENKSKRVLAENEFRVALELNPSLRIEALEDPASSKITSISPVPLPSGNILYTLPASPALLPGIWSSYVIKLQTRFENGMHFSQGTVRLHTATVQKEFPMFLSLNV